MAARPGRRRGESNLRVRATWSPQKFEAAIDASGMSRAELSRRAGVPYRNVQAYLHARANPGGAYLVVLAEALGVRPEDLYDIETTTTP